MIPQCKGKDLLKVPASKLSQGPYLVSIKYDGQYVQIQKIGNKVKFFTSGGKEFYIEEIANYLIENNPDENFIIEAEFIGNSRGKLGDRTKCGILTTWRTDFVKGYKSKYSNEKFMVFDLIDKKLPFSYRYKKLKKLQLTLHPNMQIVSCEKMNLDKAREKVIGITRDGYEGFYLKHIDHLYRPGKRVNNAIKLKKRPTADLYCIGVEPGEGKYEGKIGSLVLEDSKGRIVKVGSGLSDKQRDYGMHMFMYKVIEIEYEQILDTYIQPTFVRVRNDKTKEDID